MPSATSWYMSGRSVTISSNVPTRTDNYEFIGWCTVSTTNNNCSGDTIQPGDTYSFININYKTNNVLNLYAMWEQSLLYMQDVLDWEDQIPNTGDQMQVKDKRDEKVYWVGRQADGNIWMTQNLDFEITSKPLTSETSDLTVYNTGGYTSAAGYTQENGVIKWTPASTAITSGRIVPISTSTGDVSGLTGWADNSYAPYSAEGGDVYVYTSNSTSADTVYTSLPSCIAASHTEAECKHYHRGNYYNWSAAVASNSTNVTGLNTRYNVAQNSICPAGWRLPVAVKSDIFSQANTEFAYLLKQSNVFINYPASITDNTSYTTDGFNDIRFSSLFFVRSGEAAGSSLYGSGGYGSYWSSSIQSASNAYNLTFDSSYVYPTHYLSRDYGINVRCVARPKTMQNVAEWGGKLSIGEQTTAVDERDGKHYFVAKQADGNIWMTQNLDFEITSAGLTSDTSDLTAYNTGGYTSSAGYTKSGNIIKWTPSSTATTSGRTISGSSVSGWTNNNYAPYSAEGGDVYVYTSNSTDYDTVYTSLLSCIAASHTEAECKHYHRGNYYNWSAAVASNNTNVTELTTQYNTAQNSICPAGWKLPVGQSSAVQNATTMEFGNLMYTSKVTEYFTGTYTDDGFNAIRSNPLFFIRGGYVSNTSLYSQSVNGRYWFSSVYYTNSALSLYFYNDGIIPANSFNRYFGINVRCVARRTMQNVAIWKDSLSVGEEIIVPDVRDGKEYSVAKQADGKIWMTQNLDFEITSAGLTSDTSDLTAYNTGGYTSSAGYTKSGNIIKWTPSSTAITSGRTVPVSTTAINGAVSGLTGWANDNNAPYSAEGGDVYVYTSNDDNTSNDNTDTIYISLSSCVASHTEAECKHYHRGNYYNWSAAVASNNTNITELNTQYNTAQNSVCPAGWRLPVGAKANSFSRTNTEFAYLLKQSNIFTNYPSSLNNSPSYAVDGFNNFRISPMYFIRSGFVYGDSLYMPGVGGYYSSSSVYNSTSSYYLGFVSGGIGPTNHGENSYGLNVRCVAR